MTILISSLLVSETQNGTAKATTTGLITGLGVGSVGIVPDAPTSLASVASSGAASAVTGAIFGTIANGGVGLNTVYASLASAISGTGASLLVGNFATLVPEFIRTVLIGTCEVTNVSSSKYTFDCWKAVVHDDSKEPSEGKPLNWIAQDKRIKNIFIKYDSSVDVLPEIVLENIWDEKFKLEYIMINLDRLAAHAVRI